MTALPIALIGCGDIARTGHLPALRRCPDVTLVGVADADHSRAGEVGAAERCVAVSSVDELAALGAQALIIATPPHVTPTLTVQAVRAGMDVLCEKPMAIELDVALDVERVCAATDRVVQIGFKNRFSPLVRTLRDWIVRGELGHPIAFTLGGFDEALDPEDTKHERRIRGFLDEAPSFVHEGAHFADHLAFLTDSRPVEVHAVGLRSRPDFGSENFVSALVRYANRDVARLEIGWFFPANPAGEFRALGPDGIAILDRPGGTLTLQRRDRIETARLDRPWNDVCFDAQLAQFVSCVRTRSTPETSLAAGVASLRLGRQVADALRVAELSEADR